MYKEKYFKYKIKYLNLKSNNVSNKFLKYKAKYITTNIDDIITYNESTDLESKNFFQLIQENFLWLCQYDNKYISIKNYQIYKTNTAFWTNSMNKSSNEDFIKYYLKLYYTSWASFINKSLNITEVMVNFTIPKTIYNSDITTGLKQHVENIGIYVELPSGERSLSEQIHAESFDRLIYNQLNRILSDLNIILFDNIFQITLKVKKTDYIIIEFESIYVIGHFTFHTHDPSKSDNLVRTCHLVHEFKTGDSRGREYDKASKKYYNFIVLNNQVNYIIDPINDNINMIPVTIFFAVVLNLLIDQQQNSLNINSV